MGTSGGLYKILLIERKNNLDRQEIPRIPLTLNNYGTERAA